MRNMLERSISVENLPTPAVKSAVRGSRRPPLKRSVSFESIEIQEYEKDSCACSGRRKSAVDGGDDRFDGEPITLRKTVMSLESYENRKRVSSRRTSFTRRGGRRAQASLVQDLDKTLDEPLRWNSSSSSNKRAAVNDIQLAIQEAMKHLNETPSASPPPPSSSRWSRPPSQPQRKLSDGSSGSNASWERPPSPPQRKPSETFQAIQPPPPQQEQQEQEQEQEEVALRTNSSTRNSPDSPASPSSSSARTTKSAAGPTTPQPALVLIPSAGSSKMNHEFLGSVGRTGVDVAPRPGRRRSTSLTRSCCVAEAC